MTVGQRITQVRKERGFSRRRLSDEAGVPYPTLAGLENGDQKTSTALPALAQALGVNAIWLASGRGPMRTPRTDHPEPVTPSTVSGAPSSQFGRPDPVTLGAALDLLAFDEDQAGRYSPQSRAERLADLYVRIAADGGVRLSSENNALFDDEVRARESRTQGKEQHGTAPTTITTRRRG